MNARVLIRPMFWLCAWLLVSAPVLAADDIDELRDIAADGLVEVENVAGSIETCIDDYGHFVTTVLNGGVFRGQRVRSEDAVAVMRSNQSGAVKGVRNEVSRRRVVSPVVGSTRWKPASVKVLPVSEASA